MSDKFHLQIVEFDINRLWRRRHWPRRRRLAAREAWEVTLGLRLAVELSASLHNDLRVVGHLHRGLSSREVDKC